MAKSPKLSVGHKQQKRLKREEGKLYKDKKNKAGVIQEALTLKSSPGTKSFCISDKYSPMYLRKP